MIDSGSDEFKIAKEAIGIQSELDGLKFPEVNGYDFNNGNLKGKYSLRAYLNKK